MPKKIQARLFSKCFNFLLVGTLISCSPLASSLQKVDAVVARTSIATSSPTGEILISTPESPVSKEALQSSPQIIQSFLDRKGFESMGQYLSAQPNSVRVQLSEDEVKQFIEEGRIAVPIEGVEQIQWISPLFEMNFSSNALFKKDLLEAQSNIEFYEVEPLKRWLISIESEPGSIDLKRTFKNHLKRIDIFYSIEKLTDDLTERFELLLQERKELTPEFYPASEENPYEKR